MKRLAILVGAMACIPLFSACTSPTQTASEIEVLIVELSKGASDFQEEILADGLIEPAEYQRAIEADRACVAESGCEVGDLSWGGGERGFTADADYSTDVDPEAADQRFL